MMRLSELFGKAIYTDTGDYRGQVHDIVINLETGKLETITTEALKVKSKSEAKRIIKEKSIPYANVIAVRDIVVVSSKKKTESTEKNRRESVKPSALLRYRR